MSQRDAKWATVLAARAKSGPRWQRLSVGMRVTSVGRPRRFGTVVAIVEVDKRTQVTTHVEVRWDRSKRFTETWPTDCLVIAQETEESA